MSKVRIIIKNKDDLKNLGYSSFLPEAERHRIIEKKLVPAYGYRYLIQKLNAVAVLNKANDAGKRLRADQQYASKLYANYKRK
jgi:hypothetical protein